MEESLVSLKKTNKKSLESLKVQNRMILMSLREELNQKTRDIEHTKLKLRMNYEANLKGDTNRLLTELMKEMYSQETNCPIELKPYLNYGDLLTITKMKNQLSKDIEKESLLLKAELGKNGINEEWFEETFNKNE